jgi:hypothetical protein
MDSPSPAAHRRQHPPLSSTTPGQAGPAPDIAYDLWFRTQVEHALHSLLPRLPHDVAVTRVLALLKERRQARANHFVA